MVLSVIVVAFNIQVLVTTFELAAKLIATGFNFVKEVYTPMYTRQLNDLKVTGYLLNNFKVTDKGVGYYHILLKI